MGSRRLGRDEEIVERLRDVNRELRERIGRQGEAEGFPRFSRRLPMMREVLRRRSGSRQFAMTGHRDDEEAKQMAPQQNEQVSLAASGKQHDDAYNGKRLQQQHPSMGQQGAGLKHQYPGQEIYRKRKHPKQRRCGDVGRNVRGDRDKQAGWHRREEYPAPTRRPVYSWGGSAAGGALDRLIGRCAQQ